MEVKGFLMSPKRHDLARIIKQNDLQFTTRRRFFTLFSNSCIVNSYVYLLQEHFGISFGAMIAIGTGDMVEFCVNEDHVSKQILQKLNQNKNWAGDSFAKADQIFYECEKRFLELKTNNLSPVDIVINIFDFYPRYYVALGLYNAFWRYFGNNSEDKFFTKDQIIKIGNKRQKVAEMFPEVEVVLRKSADKIKKFLGVDGKLLPYLTVNEVPPIIKPGKCTIPELELKLRQSSNIYYAELDGGCGVITDRSVVNSIKNLVFSSDNNIKQITGHGAYPGVAIGRVTTDIRYKIADEKMILVTNMTEPKDGPFLNKFAAIVTDQGGILSHAAIFAREMKIPSVISTKIASAVFKDGDMIEVDANNGIVKKVEK